MRCTARPSACCTQRARTDGRAVRFVDVCDLDALRTAVAEAKPGCILMETISNPLLRVGQIDRIAEMAGRPAPRWSWITLSPRR
jgi:cystathionine beta-lyase/cystathionine gamma-synthase